MHHYTMQLQLSVILVRTLLRNTLIITIIIGNLPAMGRGWVGPMMNRGQLPTNSYLTVIGMHLTMHLMHPNYYQITIICIMLPRR